MPKFVELTAAKEFAVGFPPDPILRMGVNATLDNAPAADVMRRVPFEKGRKEAVAELISWLKSEVEGSSDPGWSDRARRAIGRLEELERSARWVPAYRHPEDGTVVLVTDGIRTDTAIYDADQDSYDVEHAFLDPGEVIFWKSLSSLMGV